MSMMMAMMMVVMVMMMMIPLAESGHQYGDVRWSDALFSAKLCQRHCGFGGDDGDDDHADHADHDDHDHDEHHVIYMSGPHFH